MIKFTLVSTDKEVWVNPVHVTHVNQERGGTLIGLSSPANYYIAVKESVAEVIERLGGPIIAEETAVIESPVTRAGIGRVVETIERPPLEIPTEPRRGRPRRMAE